MIGGLGSATGALVARARPGESSHGSDRQSGAEWFSQRWTSKARASGVRLLPSVAKWVTSIDQAGGSDLWLFPLSASTGGTAQDKAEKSIGAAERR